MKRLLAVYASQTGRTRALVEAAVRGARQAADEAVEIRLLGALEAGIDDLLGCDGLLLATPENFGYMAGALKDFLDRTYYPAQGKTEGLPFALLVSAGNDGCGAVAAIERIARGYGWHAVQTPLVVRGEPDDAAKAAAAELGAILAAGLALGMW